MEPSFKNLIYIHFLKNNVPQNRPKETNLAQRPYFTGKETEARTS